LEILIFLTICSIFFYFLIGNEKNRNKLRLRLGLLVIGLPKRKNFVSLESFTARPEFVDDCILDEEKVFDSKISKLSDSNILNSSNVCHEWIAMPFFLRHMQNIYVHTKCSFINYKNTKLYTNEFMCDWGKSSLIYVAPKNKKVKKIDSNRPLYVLANTGFHAIVEDLPSILLLEKKNKKFDIVIESKQSWIFKLLEIFTGNNHNYYEVSDDCWIESDSFFLASRSYIAEFVNPNLINILKKASENLTLKKFETQKIFISRSDAPWRMHPLENQFSKKFQENGYTIINLSELSVIDQIALFQNLTHVAGFHGAGFTNIIWAANKLKITELYTLNHFNSSYSTLATALGHQYENFLVDSKNFE